MTMHHAAMILRDRDRSLAIAARRGRYQIQRITFGPRGGRRVLGLTGWVSEADIRLQVRCGFGVRNG